MAKNIFRLTPSVVRIATPKPGNKAPTLLGDGYGLYLQITPPGVKSWIYRYKLPGGKTRSMGLGSVYTYSLDDARKRARECRVLVDHGTDPIDARALEASERLKLVPAPEKPPQAKQTDHQLKTFRWCADAYLLQLKDVHRSAKHSAQWRSTLARHAYPVIGSKSVDEITTAHVVEILEPLFSRIPTTAQRLQQRIEKVLAWCIVLGHRKGVENPARWRSHLSEAIPAARRKLPAKHHNALPYVEMPDFMARIKGDGSDGSILLQFLILTMTRTGEARGLKWTEVSDDLELVTIPGKRMKGGVEHRIPLCIPMDSPRGDDALACVAGLAGRSLGEVTTLAVQMGYPPEGPAYVANAGLLGRLLHNFQLVASDWQEVTSFDALPDVAILMLDWNDTLEFGRHLIWHHVRGTAAFPSFSYIIDPRPNIPDEQQITSNWSHLRLEPAWFIEVTPMAANGAKRK